MKTILSQLYDLKTANTAPDYIEAAEKLAGLQNKRSLIVLVTNSRDEDVDELMMAAKLLKRKHLVLVANIREAVIDKIHSQPIDNLDDALLYAGTRQYVSARKQAQSKVKNQGVYSVDCLASELATRICNSYLEIKRSGVL